MAAKGGHKSGRDLPTGVYKRGDVYWVRWRTAGGKELRKRCGRDLQAAKRERERLVDEQRLLAAAGTTGLPRVLDNWMTRHELRSRPRTVSTSRSVAKRLLEGFGAIDLRRLTEVDVQRYVQRRRKDVGVQRINRELAGLKAAIRLAVRQKVLQALPCHVELLPAPLKKKIPQAIALADFQKLVAAADDLDAGQKHPTMGPLLRTAYLTGMRHQELLHLDWADIDFEQLLVRVRAKLYEDFIPKSHCERDLPIPASLATYLADYREKLSYHGDSDPVFQPIRRNPRPKGTNPRRWFETCHHVRKVFEKAGLGGKGKPVGLHTLRHSYCTNLVRSGAGVEELRQLAGHSSIVVSQRYLWSDNRSRRAAAEAMFDIVLTRPRRT